MNAPTPVDAVGPAAQAAGSSVTRQAIEAALAGLASDSATQQAATLATPASEGSGLRAQEGSLHEGTLQATSAPLSALQAQNSSWASPTAALQNPAAPAAPADAAALVHNVAAPPAMPLQGVLAVPVALSSLQTAHASSSARSNGTAQRTDHYWVQRREDEPRQRGEQDIDEPASPDSDAHESPAPVPPEAVVDERVTRWISRLKASGQDEALRDLQLQRWVLLVVPKLRATAATVPARALLLGARGLLDLSAQWWPGAAEPAADSWRRFRLFRDGDLLLRGGLRTRAGSLGCRLLLGTGSAAAANAALGAASGYGGYDGLNDTGTARLLLAERARVAQALVSQWTLLLLVVPEEAAHA